MIEFEDTSMVDRWPFIYNIHSLDIADRASAISDSRGAEHVPSGMRILKHAQSYFSPIVIAIQCPDIIISTQRLVCTVYEIVLIIIVIWPCSGRVFWLTGQCITIIWGTRCRQPEEACVRILTHDQYSMRMQELYG